MGRVTLSRAGSFYRIQCDPVDALPPSFVRPATYTSHSMAADAAGQMAKATGFSVLDMTKKESRND